MRAFLESTIASVVMTLAACGQSGVDGPAGTGFNPPTSGGPSSTADAAADTGNGSVGTGIDGLAEGGPGIGIDGSAGDGPSTRMTDGSVRPVGTPLGPHATAGRLLLDIGGTTQGTDYAFLKVTGKAKLGGELHLTFAPGFVPTSGQKFIVVTAAGGVSGAFASVTTSGIAVTPGQDATTFYVTVN